MNIRNTRNAVIAVVLAALLAGCAAAPPAAPQAAAPGAGLANTTPPAAPTAATPTREPPDPPGFRRMVREGAVYFCQSRAATGSRARVVETCYTREEIERRQKNSDTFMKEMQEAGSHGTLATDSPN